MGRLHSFGYKKFTAVVLLFCSQADSSVQVKRELSLADKYKKPVFWLRVERVEPNNLSYFLTSTQWLDWMDMRDATLEKLVEDIKNLNDADVKNCSESNGQTQRGVIAGFVNSTKDNWAKGVLAFHSVREAAECAARVYFSIGQNYPDSTLILPTGRSATMLFRAMLRIAGEYDGCLFGEAHLISDTETFGVYRDISTCTNGRWIYLRKERAQAAAVG